MVFHRQEADEADDEEGDRCRQSHVDAKGQHQPVEKAAADARHRIDLLFENQRCTGEQDVTDDTASASRDASHDDGHPDSMPAVDGLLHAGNGEERKSQRVEDEPGIVKSFQVMGKDNDEDLRKGGTHKIEGGCHPEGGDAQHHIADGSATDGNGNTADETAKPVEMMGGGMADAGYGKGEGSQEFYHLENGLHELWLVGHIR